MKDLRLPEDFVFRMRELLKEEYRAFIDSYEDDRVQGLRVNSLKIGVDEFKRISPFSIESIPWSENGFYYSSDERPGRHPYHEAGLYYIQEPSAMAVGELVDPKPGEKVLDLCASPGGKTTHMASKMEQRGLLVSNEINATRARVLAQNVKRMGIRNAVVTNEPPDRLASKFEGFFDRILVDAPCSGEGMFRKNPQACDEWSLQRVEMCAQRQLEIFGHAEKMLKAGGRLVYSTCTFSPEEDEGTVNEFLKANTSFEVEQAQFFKGFDCGRPEWAGSNNVELAKTVRLWPHHVRGEGHYVAVLSKGGHDARKEHKHVATLKDKVVLRDYFRFLEEHVVSPIDGEYVMFAEQLYMVDQDMVNLDGLRVICPGWHLGALKKGRFEPDHAMAMALGKDDVNFSVNFGSNSDEISEYLTGETLKFEGAARGWHLVLVDGYSTGWGKAVDGLLKNHYPKELRIKGRI